MKIEHFTGHDQYITINGEEVLGHLFTIDGVNYIAEYDDSGTSNCLDCVLSHICIKHEYGNNPIPDEVKTLCEIESNINHHYINFK